MILKEYHVQIILANGMVKNYGVLTDEEIEHMNPIQLTEKLSLPYKCSQIIMMNIWRVR